MPYMCEFKSHNSFLLLLDPITAVVVSYIGRPAILYDSFTLHCEVTGTVESIMWWKDGHIITADNTTVFGMNNKTLTLHLVQHSDNGSYLCQAFNVLSNMTSSPHTVEINCKYLVFSHTKTLASAVTLFSLLLCTALCDLRYYPCV